MDRGGGHLLALGLPVDGGMGQSEEKPTQRSVEYVPRIRREGMF